MKVKIKVLIIVLSLFYVDRCFSAFKSGNDLYNDMLNYNKSDTGNCSDLVGASVYLGYIEGAADTTNGIMWCSQNGITAGQLAKIVGKFLEQNPEMLHLSADYLIHKALEKSFPCKK